jgi:hypothetical protein
LGINRCNGDEAPKLRVHLDHWELVADGVCGLSMNCCVEAGIHIHTSSMEVAEAITSEMAAWLD